MLVNPKLHPTFTLHNCLNLLEIRNCSNEWFMHILKVTQNGSRCDLKNRIFFFRISYIVNRMTTFLLKVPW
jgi:hypothetical protein